MLDVKRIKKTHPFVQIYFCKCEQEIAIAQPSLPVSLLREAPAVKSPGIVTKPLAVLDRSRKQDVVHGDHGHVLLGAGVAAVGEG